jgi:glycosyltransferase involved in cell wall biosynthesis
MAAALARQMGDDVHLFVHDLRASEAQIRQQYAIANSPLRIWRLHAKRWPSCIYGSGNARFLTYNSAVAAIFGLHPTWHRVSRQQRVLFVRSRLELLYWGLLRTRLWWMRDWLFVYEAHDLYATLEAEPSHDGVDGQIARMSRALANYDLVICMTASLKNDIEALTLGAVRPVVLSLASGIPRLHDGPRAIVNDSTKRAVLGYVGTVDRTHGVDQILRALYFLPDGIRLRIVGRLSEEGDARGAPAWLSDLISDPCIAKKVEFCPPVSYSQVAEEIDKCDLMLLPAGASPHRSRYVAPLKLFDYMARGKPIIAAGVPAHLELLQDGINARLYRPGDAEHLAACIMAIVHQPEQAEAIARTAWEQSARYTYDARARCILDLLDAVREQREAPLDASP